MPNVFVYGTLREGEDNHHYLAGALQLARTAKTRGRLVDTGCGYPAMLLAGGQWTQGELYEVDGRTLRRLDRLEDYYGENDSRNLYDRVEVTVETDQGSVRALTYIFKEDVGLPPIEGNDWKAYRL
jgi:gamma-L-glutamyl-butirosin B gamma-L-glutamyl cyclotransferase